jgi:lysophospholipase
MDEAPLHHDLAEGPETGRGVWVKCADGTRLRVVLWPAPGARGTVLIFPGRTEYCEKYGRAARSLAERGYATAAIDWRGQGLADRLLADPMVGHVGHFIDYQQDVAAFVQAVRAAGLPEPFHLIAHSMGGCIGLRALHQGLPVASAAFSAPMWGIRISAAVRPFAWGMGWAARRMGAGRGYAPGTRGESYVTSQPFAGNMLTKDPDFYAYMQRQTAAVPGLGLGGPSLHWLYEALAETNALRRMPAPPHPGLCGLGTDEQIVDPRPIREIAARWPGFDLAMFENAEHELMMERDEVRNRFFDLTTDLFDRHADKARAGAKARSG